MYQTAMPGILEMLMNALSLPTSRRAVQARRVPHRRVRQVSWWSRESLPATETYIDAARLSRWNR